SPVTTGEAQSSWPGTCPTHDSWRSATFPVSRVVSFVFRPVCAAFPWYCGQDAPVAGPAPACAPGAAASVIRDTAKAMDVVSERTRCLTSSPFDRADAARPATRSLGPVLRAKPPSRLTGRPAARASCHGPEIGVEGDSGQAHLTVEYRWYLNTDGMQSQVQGGSQSRLSRVDRKAQTRERLVESAHAVFMRRGFHAATLEEIAADAGVTKGAVYSNFHGEKELVIAGVEGGPEQPEHGDRRGQREANDIESLARRHARIMVKDDPDGRWSSVLTSAWAATADDPVLRKQLLDIQLRATSFIGQSIKETADRTGIEFPYP